MRKNPGALSPVKSANFPHADAMQSGWKVNAMYHADLITEWKRTFDRKSKKERNIKEKWRIKGLSAAEKPGEAEPMRR